MNQSVQPIIIARGNATAVTGMPWSWCKRAARDLGVPILRHGRKAAIEAAAFLEALKRCQPRAESEDTASDRVDEDELAALRRRVARRAAR